MRNDKHMTITEKILAGHSGKEYVKPGDVIWVDVDVRMTHDVCGPGTIGIFKKEFGKDARVWDKEKLVIRNVKDLKVYQAAYKFAMDIFEITKKFPKE